MTIGGVPPGVDINGKMYWKPSLNKGLLKIMEGNHVNRLD
jgi:hypothetical protein